MRAIAVGGADLQPILDAMRAAEARRRHLTERIAELNRSNSAFTSETAAALEQQVLEKLVAWRATMRW